MKYYKELLLKKLSDDGWELTTQDDETDWWLEEYWIIKSVKQSYGYTLHVLFLVDPMYDGNKKSQAVWAIAAAETLPANRPINDECLVEMDLQKGKFDIKLNTFVEEINEQRSKKNL